MTRYQLGLVRHAGFPICPPAVAVGLEQVIDPLPARSVDETAVDKHDGGRSRARAHDVFSFSRNSTRYLHKLFEADRRTVSLYIKGLRLDRARRDLLDPRLAGRPISAIAYDCGFGDLSGFNRAFKEAYAVSPKELRDASTSA